MQEKCCVYLFDTCILHLWDNNKKFKYILLAEILSGTVLRVLISNILILRSKASYDLMFSWLTNQKCFDLYLSAILTLIKFSYIPLHISSHVCICVYSCVVFFIIFGLHASLVLVFNSISSVSCINYFLLSLWILSPRLAGIRRRDGILEGCLGQEECLLHIQQLWQPLQLLLAYKKELEDQHLPLQWFWHVLYVTINQVLFILFE